jgi:hypothetical protein
MLKRSIILTIFNITIPKYKILAIFGFDNVPQAHGALSFKRPKKCNKVLRFMFRKI